jgi:uncharacterized protein YbjT (DUF2867 family)
MSILVIGATGTVGGAVERPTARPGRPPRRVDAHLSHPAAGWRAG